MEGRHMEERPMRCLLVGLAGLAAVLGGVSIAPAQAEEFYQETKPMFENCADGSLDRVRKEGIVLGESGERAALDPRSQHQGGERHRRRDQQRRARLARRREAHDRVDALGSEIPSLLSKRTDVIAQNIHVNPDRVKVISFTGPAWWYGPIVLVQKGNPDGIKSYDDFKGKNVGAISGSAAENYLRRIGANTQPFKAPSRGAAEPGPGPGQVRGRGRRHLHRVRRRRTRTATSRR